MKPTQEQIKEFWEWCGLRYEADQDCFKVIFPDGEWYNFGSNWEMGEVEPPIDLNNLFKYAAPKIWLALNKRGMFYAMQRVWLALENSLLETNEYCGKPEQALFQICDELREVINGN